MRDEIEEYKNFLSKAKVIVTTNYDTLTEDLLAELDKRPTIYIGQKRFFLTKPITGQNYSKFMEM